jgi:hypothetical protein
MKILAVAGICNAKTPSGRFAKPLRKTPFKACAREIMQILATHDVRFLVFLR